MLASFFINAPVAGQFSNLKREIAAFFVLTEPRNARQYRKAVLAVVAANSPAF